MKLKRIISTLLAALMLMGAFTVVGSASDTVSGHISKPEDGWKTNNNEPTIHYYSGQGAEPVYEKDKNGNSRLVGYQADGEQIIFNAEDKLDTMDLRFVRDGYELYVDNYSGEVATRCIATGEILFTNPYNIGNYDSTQISDSIKNELMSQLVVTYTDITTDDKNEYHSYEWAATRGQIIVKNIKNGIRVEYTIGREEARMLVPRQIEKNSFETKIVSVMEEAVGYNLKPSDDGYDAYAIHTYKQVMTYYSLKDPNSVTIQSIKDSILAEFPITKKMAIYVLDESTSNTELAKIESLIKTYCPDYSYEDLDEDHLLTEYESEDKNPPLFKMALEYTLDEGGVSVRLPANGIRFNESLYRLDSVQILPFMGAGYNPNEGYTFFPDGSGTLFDFEKIAELGGEVEMSGTIYGTDFAYHTIDGKLEETLRYPVFGLVETENIVIQPETPEGEEGTVEGEGATEGEASGGAATVAALTEDEQVYEKTRGFVAIVEEGDALMKLASYHMGIKSPYNTVTMTVFPRPKDTYNVADAISVGANDDWTVVSARKYTGNFKIRYVMLTDDDVAAEKGITSYYETTYAGMAQAYRDYLEKSGVLTKLTAEDVDEDMPLYIETFGAIWSTKKILSIPVDVTIPLTSFDDIVTIHKDLGDKGINNINFIMQGYTDGGMENESVPYKLKWEKAVEGEYDFESLVAYAKEHGIGLFPDFDFVFFTNNSLFDGLTLKKHAVKTIDNRYTSKREYSATKQTHIGYYELAISPAYFSHFYEKFTKNYLEYDPTGISVATLGSYLNSDFDEDEPYNRDDSKKFTMNAFEYLSNNYENVMTSGGNAYTWKYVDYITDIALDSSRYAQSSASVPFLGMVLHGYVQFAGTPINMEGNIEYAMLKAIESGAGLKFVLSYQNTDELKEWVVLSQYYSIRYDIWLEDLIALYNENNAALSSVQTSKITKHEFVEGGIRIPDNDELLADAKTAIDDAIAAELAYNDKIAQEKMDLERNARENTKTVVESILNKLDVSNPSSSFVSQKNAYEAALADLATVVDPTTYEVKFNSLFAYARMYLNTVVDINEDYILVNEVYREAIMGDETISEARRQELIAAIDSIDAETRKLVDPQLVIAEVIEKLNAAYDAAISAGATKLPARFEYELDIEEELEEEVEDISAKTYSSDDNKIVYEEYENGNAFILNFNNYAVMVEINGTTYTLGAYGYIALKAQNA